jgi:hypothetical protein
MCGLSVVIKGLDPSGWKAVAGRASELVLHCPAELGHWSVEGWLCGHWGHEEKGG